MTQAAPTIASPAEATSPTARVVIFTERHTVLGDVQTGLRRLSDVVNDPLRQQLPVENARINRSDRLDETIAAYAQVVFRRQVMQGILIMSEPPRPAQARLANYVPKTAVRVAALLPAFLIEGTIYVSGKTDPATHVLSGPEEFAVLNEATVTLIQRKGAPLSVPTALINREHIELVTLP